MKSERRRNDRSNDEPGIDESYIPGDPGEETDEEDAFKDYVTGSLRPQDH